MTKETAPSLSAKGPFEGKNPGGKSPVGLAGSRTRDLHGSIAIPKAVRHSLPLFSDFPSPCLSGLIGLSSTGSATCPAEAMEGSWMIALVVEKRRVAV
jgi:hypothetical protein